MDRDIAREILVRQSYDTSIDAAEFIGERGLPSWVREHRNGARNPRGKSSGKYSRPKSLAALEQERPAVNPKISQRRAKDTVQKDRVNHRNIRKTWVKANVEQGVPRNVVTPKAKVKLYAGEIRPSPIPATGPVAHYAFKTKKLEGFRRYFAGGKPPDLNNAEGTVSTSNDTESIEAPMAFSGSDERDLTLKAALSDNAFLKIDQSKLPLRNFDVPLLANEDRPPEAWLASGSKAHAPYFYEGSWKWRSCAVVNYSHERQSFEIQFLPAGIRKFVDRLNLRFDAENAVEFEERRNVAISAREEAKGVLRLDHFISCIPVAVIQPIRQSMLYGVHEKVFLGLPPTVTLPQPESSEGVLFDSLTEEVIANYIRGMKKSIVMSRVAQDADFRARYQELKLPKLPTPSEAPIPLYGKVSVPEHSFAENRAVIESLHISKEARALQMLNWLIHTWEDNFASIRYAKIHHDNLELPCSLPSFVEAQKQHGDVVESNLEQGWRRSFGEQLVDQLQDVYDFFVSDKAAYLRSVFSRLMRQFELRMREQLRKLLQDSLSDLLAHVKRYRDISSQNELYPDESVDPSGIRSVFGICGATPLLEVSVVITSDGEVALQPSIDDVKTALTAAVDKMVQVIRGRTNVDADLMTLLHLQPRPIFNIGAGDELFRDVDKMISDAKDSLCKWIDEAAAQPMAICDRFQKYWWLWRLDLSRFDEEVLRGTSTKELEAFMKKVRTFHEAALSISVETKNSECLGLFRVVTTDTKELLIEKAEVCRDGLISFMVDELEVNTESVLERYDAILNRIAQTPVNEKELQALWEFIEKGKKTVDALIAETDAIHLAYDSLSEFQFRSSDRDTMLTWSMKECPAKIVLAVQEAEERLERKKRQMMDKLAIDKDKFDDFLETFDEEVEVIKTLSSYDDWEGAFETVNAFLDKLREAGMRAEDLNMREQVFGFMPTEYALAPVEEAIAPFVKLWTMVYDFFTNRNEWLTGPFIQLNGAKIDAEVTDWWKTSYKLSKSLEAEHPGPSECAARLREDTTEFRQHLPIIQSLASPALQQRHWELLSHKIGKTIEPDEELTLEALLDLNIAAFIEDVQSICVAAEKEFSLSNALAAMMQEWSEKEFEVVAHKSGGSIVRGVDDIITLLDDHIVKTQTMRGSPFIKPIEADAKAWEQQLKYAQSVLDEWIAMQRTWLYLEPIFSSEDIMRQLPTEARRFKNVDVLWKKTMEETKANPTFMVQAHPDKGLLQKFVAANEKLELIQKGLSDYLEIKRLYFPRFFFLSNDELLEILSQTKEPRAVQPHLGKAFEGVNKVKFEDDLKITIMISSEGEQVHLDSPVDPENQSNKGCVERWLDELEKMQWQSIRSHTVRAVEDYENCARSQWVLNWPAQVVLGVSQIFWTRDVANAIRSGGTPALREFEQSLNMQLQELVQVVRGKLSKLARKTLGALTTIDVHARDTVTRMVQEGVKAVSDFGWIRELRYYWEPSWKDGQAIKTGDSTVVARIVNAQVLYGYEYLGNSMRLVITPLTDRCYRTMIGAIGLLYGGAPEGPAGTGKTETVKDLSKAVAIQCVVFNCSDGLDYLAMAKFFKGLAGCGSWCCFDEFNRINIEVLSVIAQQILTITKAKAAGQTEFDFEGTHMRINHNANVFITMNPGYAGRAELPDNLKALFRPCAMMVPNYALISEIRLYSFGFADPRANAQKLVRVLQLSSEQLSSQKHYDYGMRAVNSILVASGNLRQQLGDDPVWTESMLVLRAVNDVNLPKFTVEDLPLFKGITSDLFPGVNMPSADHGPLVPAIRDACKNGVVVARGRQFKLKDTEAYVKKVVQLYEMVLVRHGVMVVGQTCSGKTCAIHTLAQAMTVCHDSDVEGSISAVQIHTMNPKSIKSGQLYGNFDENTHEWSDGILAVIYRNSAKARDVTDDRQWVVFDGPVDAVWIENMNTVLDDNKKLCLMSGEIIKMSDTMTMMFEAEDLEQASPATVSRVGMIFCETRNLGWEPVRDVWVESLDHQVWGDHTEFVSQLFDWLLDPALYFVEKFCKVPAPVTRQELIFSLTSMMTCMMDAEDGITSDVPKALECAFILSITWSVGAIVDAAGRKLFDEYMRALLNNDLEGNECHSDFLLKNREYDGGQRVAQLVPPDSDSLYNFTFDMKKGLWLSWLDTAPKYSIPKDATFQSIVVPTVDTICNAWLMHKLMTHGFHVLCTGETGTGKSVSIKQKLLSGMDEKYTNIMLNFSAQTSANATQDIIDGKLTKRRKGVLGPDLGNICIIFVDDLNMPSKEEYGAQPPIEILRQWMDHAGWYDRKENTYRQLVDVQFVGAMGPPEGGRTRITQRYVRHFNLINFVPFNRSSLSRIFGLIIDWFFAKGFPGAVKQLADDVVLASVQIYNEVSAQLLPTPSKSHYTFNLRDLSKIFQGVLQGDSGVIKDNVSFLRLWAHECIRVFHDRLSAEEDRTWFLELLAAKTKQMFDVDWAKLRGANDSILYGNFADARAVHKVYAEFEDRVALKKVMQEYLEDYNMMTSKPMTLVLFENAIEHVTRISRVINLPYGNALLVGVGGSGRKSLTTLAVAIADFKLFRIEISKTYGMVEWRDDLKKVLAWAGRDNEPTVFLFDDTQIVLESFVEDINGILNTGEVPNLYASDELTELMEALQNSAKVANFEGTSPAELWSFFVQRCRTNLHIVLTMSPIGDAFRRRLLNFPSLVNCCTIDWFTEWPEEALYSVAHDFLKAVELSDKVRVGVIDVCVDMQRRMQLLSQRFLESMGRHYYITPTSYLGLIDSFKNLLDVQRTRVRELKERYDNGLLKLKETAEQVDDMKTYLRDLQPKLKEAQVETDALLVKIAADTKSANKVKAVVEQEEQICNAQAEEANALKASCEADLARALPALEAALTALRSLKKDQIVEVKGMSKPPGAVRITMTAVCIMMGVKPTKIKDPNGGPKKVDDYWESAKKNLLSDARFLQNLMEYDKDHIPPAIITKVKEFVADPEFQPDIVKKGSVAAAGLCKWVHAMVVYDEVAKDVEPKRIALAKAETDLKEATEALAEKQAALKEVMDKLELLSMQLKEAEDKKEGLQTQVTDCELKLGRAEQLINGLGGEKSRWTQLSIELQEQYDNVTGDIMLASGVIAYLGVFVASYRSEAVAQWSELLQVRGITCATDFQLRDVLGEPVKIRQWIISKLPNDSFSIDNAIVLEKSTRWPLMIDPQGQANRWVKDMEKERSLRVVKQSASNFVRTLENALQFGNPVLIENVAETLDPILEPLLLKQIVVTGGVPMTRLGDNSVEYDPNFKLYMTTNLSNPHYPPELCVKVNLLNFMATEDGLEDQMLGTVVTAENPELEQKRVALVQEDADNKKALKELEDKILALLKNAEGNILDDEVLINTLKDSKVTSNVIEEKVKEAAKTQEKIAKVRQGYIPVAFRASQLFFCIADLNIVDPMYQYSLEWFINLFLMAIRKAPKGASHDDRVEHLNETFTYVLYENVCRSLFAKDKLLFSFLLTVKILKGDKLLEPSLLRFFLQGSTSLEVRKEKPESATWMYDSAWNNLLALSDLEPFKSGGLEYDFEERLGWWKSVAETSEPEPLIRGRFGEDYSLFERLCILRAVRPDMVVPGVQKFVAESRGTKFIEIPPFDLDACYADSNCVTPLIFVLTPGADPMTELYKLADNLDMTRSMEAISLGQGQGPLAERAIEAAKDQGTWVVLQNCHLSVSWLPTLEKICEELSPERVDASFRLWLTSEPSPHFPAFILQNGVKMTNEPPKGLRANLLNSYSTIDEQYVNSVPEARQRELKKLLFGLCFFHASCTERKRFGPLGWNNQYVFSGPDLSISKQQLSIFLGELTDEEPVPYAALSYLAGECNYGGRVTDDKDRRCLMNSLSDFYCSSILDDSYRFSSSGKYYAPPDGPLESFVEYIRNLPYNEGPEVFGMHDNANISCALAETDALLKTALSMQPKETGAGGGSEGSSLGSLAADIESRMPKPFDIERALLDFPVKYEESMNTVLTQELIRFNKLLGIVAGSLSEIQRALQGLVVMSAELEAMGVSMSTGQVPKIWSKAAYPSLKPLGSWVNDFLQRLRFLGSWMESCTSPPEYWLGGFYFPQAFLTGTLQNFARKYQIPIDQVDYDMRVLSPAEESKAQECRAKDGAYIHGLFLQGARWDLDGHVLAESRPRELFATLPRMHLIPKARKDIEKVEGIPEQYTSDVPNGTAHMAMTPCYRTSARAGVLLTTGHSTNFVMFFRLPMAGEHEQKFWVKQGVALLLSLDS